MKVVLQVSPEMVAEMLALAGRGVVDAWFQRDYIGERDGWVCFAVDAPDAPEGTSRMEPTYERESDGTVTMNDPGWR